MKAFAKSRPSSGTYHIVLDRQTMRSVCGVPCSEDKYAPTRRDPWSGRTPTLCRCCGLVESMARENAELRLKLDGFTELLGQRVRAEIQIGHGIGVPE